MVAHVLDHHRGLLARDERRRLLDELLGVHLEQAEHASVDAGEDSGRAAARDGGRLGHFAHEVVGHAGIRIRAHVVRLRAAGAERVPRGELAAAGLGTLGAHGEGVLQSAYAQVGVDACDGVAAQLLVREAHRIGVLPVNSLPQLLELAAGEVVGQRVLGDLLLGTTDHAVERVLVVDTAHQRLHDLRVSLVSHRIGQLHDEVVDKRAVGDLRAELVSRHVVFVDEVAFVERLVHLFGLLLGEGHRLVADVDGTAAEEVHLHLLGAIAQRLLDVALQVAHEGLVALRGYDGQKVHAVHVIGTQQLHVLAVAVLIHAQAHAAADLLALRGLGARFLKRADLEDVGVVPALTKRRVAEDETHRLLEGEQALLVLEDELVAALSVVVVNADAVCGLGLLLPLGLYGVSLLVDGEVAVVHRMRVVLGKVPCVGAVYQVVGGGVRQPLGHNGLVLLLEDLAVAHGCVVAGKVAVLGHLIDEEQRQALDATAKQRFLLLQVALDGLADLDALHVVGGAVVVHLADGYLLAVEEPNVAGPPLLRRHDAIVAAGYPVALVGLQQRVARGQVDVVALVKALRHLAHLARGAHLLELDHGLRRLALGHNDVLQVQIAVGTAHVLQGETLHLDALD